MNQPVLYTLANAMQRQSTERVIHKFVDIFKLHPDGKDSLVDVGCGTGDVLMELVRPLLPDTYKEIVGIDISPKMINYSRKTYANCKKIRFDVLDIAAETLPSEYQEKFDHVTSFFCLHWVKNQKQAIRNVYNMLAGNGNCLLTFVSSIAICQGFKFLSTNPKFSEYMYDVDKYQCPSENIINPLTFYSKLFKQAGFSCERIEIKEEMFAFEGYQKYEEYVFSISGFLDRMPFYKRKEFVANLSEYLKTINLCEEIPNKDDCRYFEQYNLIIAYANK